MKAITIWAPWAQCIARHGKDVENRDWPVPDSMVGEWVAIHVGKNPAEWKELMARVRRDDWEGIPEEVWNGLMAHYALCEADGSTTSPPDSGRIIALACVRGTVDGTYNNTSTINGTLEYTMKAANSPWVTQGGLAHVYSPVLPLPRALVDDIGEVKGAQKYWNLDDSVAAKLTAFLEFAAASVEERIRSTALAVVAEPCDDGEDSTDRCPTCGYSIAGHTVAEDDGLYVLGQFYCAAHLPGLDRAEPSPEQPQVDGDGVVQDDDDEPPVRPSGDRYADPPEPGGAEHGGIIGRYWCGETHIGATQVIGVGLWRVLFSAKDRPDGCHMGSPAPGELVQRKRKPDDASRHVDCFLVPKTWRSGSRGYDDLEAGELKEGDHGIVHLGMAEILTEQATASSDGKSELWRWSTVAKSTQGWVDVLLARGDLQMAFYLVQREIETSRPAEPAPEPPPVPPLPAAQQQLFPDPAPAPVAAAEPVPAAEPAPSGTLQLGYTPELADVVDAELVEVAPLVAMAMSIARSLDGHGHKVMPFGWLLKALRMYSDTVDVEQVIDALLAHPTMFDVHGAERSIQSVRLVGTVADLETKAPGAFRTPGQVDEDAELLRAHLMRRAGRETVGNCRIYGTGPLRAWTDDRILTIARSSSDWFTVDGATVGLRYPDQAALDDICRKAFSDQAAEWLPTGTLTEVFARALKVNQPEAAAWVNRAVGESLCLRKRDKGFGYVWVEVANVAD